MNTQLNPPPVPPLSPSKRSRLRNRVMDQADPTTARSAWRWAAPLVAVGAVAAVVAGTLAVTGNPSADPGVTGKPAPSSASTAAKGPKVDLGAVPAALLPELKGACQGAKNEDVKLLWTRQVRGFTGESTTAVAVAEPSPSRWKKGDPPPRTLRGPSPGTTTTDLGARTCRKVIPASAKTVATSVSGSLTDEAWIAQPTPAQGLVVLCTCGFAKSKDRGTLQMWSLFRPRPEIARVEARSVWKGKFGEWTEGIVDGGFAYTQVEAYGKFAQTDIMKQEVRAFDAAGNPVPVKLPWPN